MKSRIGRRTSFLILFGTFLYCLFAISIAVIQYRIDLLDEYDYLGRRVVSNIQDYLEKGLASSIESDEMLEDDRVFENALMEIPKEDKKIKRAYVLKTVEGHFEPVIMADNEGLRTNKLNEAACNAVEEESYDTIIAGNSPESVVTDGEMGYVLSIFVPIQKRNYVNIDSVMFGLLPADHEKGLYISVDLSLDELYGECQSFFLHMAATFAAISAFFITIALIIVKKMLVNPIYTLDTAVKKLVSVKEKKLSIKESGILEMKIHSGDEIEVLSDSFVSMAKDLDELWDELVEMKAKADSANSAKTTFLANISHEIRTPLNVILGMSELLTRYDLNEEALDMVINIKDMGNVLLNLVNDILDVTKMEAGKIELYCDKYKIIELLHDIVLMTRMRIQNKPIELILDIDEKMPSVIYGDMIRVRQIMTNLLSNATKYTEKGVIRMKVFVTDKDESSYLHFSVEDTGMGIREEDNGELFKAFRRIDEKENRNIEGTGLGLAICKQLVTRMEGEIGFKSEYGKGSEFFFSIPQKIIDRKPIGEVNLERNSIVKKRFTFKTENVKVLVIDDNDVNIKVAEGLLHAYGIKVYAALSGKQGLDILQKVRMDLIFIDHMMPGMDGFETLAAIRDSFNAYNLLEENRQIPIFALSANAVSGMREKFIDGGFHEFLSKPIDVGRLENILVQFLPEDKVMPYLDMDAENGYVYQGDDAKEDTFEGKHLAILKRKLPDVDIMQGIGNCENVIDRYRKVLKVVIKNARDRQKEIHGPITEHELKNFEIMVHGLKGVTASIGAMVISERAKKMEYAAKDGNIAYINENFRGLMIEYAELIGRMSEALDEMNLLDEKLNGKDEKPKHHLTEDEKQKILNEVLAAINEYELDLAAEKLKLLLDSDISREEREVLDNVGQLMMSFEYDKIQESIMLLIK